MDAYKAALAAHDPGSGDPKPEPPQVRPWYGDPTWCGRCASRILQALAELDELAGTLRRNEDGYPSSSAGERVSGTPGGAVPAADEIDELYSVLARREREYRDLRGLSSAPRRGWLADELTQCIDWLLHHLDGILASPLAENFGGDVLELHGQFRAATKTGVRRIPKPLRCPSCRLLLLSWLEGEKYVQCGNPDCGLLMTLAEYEAAVDKAAGDAPAA